MLTHIGRACARHSGAVALAPMLLAACAAAAQATTPANGAPLTLSAASALAVSEQPLLDAQRHAVRAARAHATAAAQLPDPMLVGGVSDVPLSGPDRWSLRDSDTQVLLAFKQSFPGGRERALLGRRGIAEAQRLDSELEGQRREVRRAAALAWLDAWQAARAQPLLTEEIAEATHQHDAVAIAYRAGRAAQTDVLAARVAVALLEDRHAAETQREWQARHELRRWIGDDAERPLAPTLPPRDVRDTDALLAALADHPHLAAQAAAVTVAETDVALARADYVPDWSVELGYGWRPDLADMAMVRLELGLPVFTRNRQDRVVESRAAELGRAESLRDDWLRQHRAHVRLNAESLQRLLERSARYDTAILPQAQQRLDAALAAYGAGSGTLLAVIDARRTLLDLRLQRLALEADAARHQVQLEYFLPSGASS